MPGGMESGEDTSSRKSTQEVGDAAGRGRKSHIRELLRWSSEGFLQPGLGNQARHPRERKLGGVGRGLMEVPGLGRLLLGIHTVASRADLTPFLTRAPGGSPPQWDCHSPASVGRLALKSCQVMGSHADLDLGHLLFFRTCSAGRRATWRRSWTTGSKP